MEFNSPGPPIIFGFFCLSFWAVVLFHFDFLTFIFFHFRLLGLHFLSFWAVFFFHFGFLGFHFLSF